MMAHLVLAVVLSFALTGVLFTGVNGYLYFKLDMAHRLELRAMFSGFIFHATDQELRRRNMKTWRVLYLILGWGVSLHFLILVAIFFLMRVSAH